MKENKLFKAWLKSVGQTIESFAMLTGNHYSTVAKWASGAVPRSAYLDRIRQKFPDCPLLNNVEIGGK